MGLSGHRNDTGWCVEMIGVGADSGHPSGGGGRASK